MDGGALLHSCKKEKFLRDREELYKLVIVFSFIFVASDRFRLVRRKIVNEIRIRFSYIVSL